MLSAINYVGVRPGSSVQTALTIAKIGAIGVLLVLLFGMGTPHMPASLGADRSRAGSCARWSPGCSRSAAGTW